MASVRIVKQRHKWWFAAFIAFNLAVVFLALVVNPYRLLPFSIVIPGINDIKPALYENQRYVKLFDMAHQKPKTVLLGSSRVLWGIDPKNPVLNKKSYTPVYNAGVLGPPLYEIRKYFDHALAVQPHMKRVILALDFYAFNSKFDNREFSTESSFGKNTKELLKVNQNLLFNTKAILQTMQSSITRTQTKSLREDGRLTPAPLEARDIYQDFFNPPADPTIASNEQKASGKNKSGEKGKLAAKSMRNELYFPFKLSKIDFDSLRYIVATCQERGIELYIFTTPTLRAAEIDVYHKIGIWKDYQAFQRQLASIHPFWDFTSWNEITMKKDNYVDGSHFVFAVGEKIINKILGAPESGTPDSFGRYVTKDTVNSHLNVLNAEWKLSNTKAFKKKYA